MSQRDRRREPYPWTWEPAAAVTGTLAAVAVAAVQVGRAGANLAAGGTLRLPVTAGEWLTSTPAVLAGHSAAGLVPADGPTAGSRLLGCSIGVVAVLLLALLGAAARAVWRRWGPSRLRGVATPAEVRDALGLQRLRRSYRLIRPDLFTADPQEDQ